MEVLLYAFWTKRYFQLHLLFNTRAFNTQNFYKVFRAYPTNLDFSKKGKPRKNYFKIMITSVLFRLKFFIRSNFVGGRFFDMALYLKYCIDMARERRQMECLSLSWNMVRLLTWNSGQTTNLAPNFTPQFVTIRDYQTVTNFLPSCDNVELVEVGFSYKLEMILCLRTNWQY